MQGRRYEGGFSFIEVLIAIVLVGIAIASLLAANGSFTKTNAAGTELSTAEFLLEQIKELTVVLPVVDPNTGMSTFGPEADETTLADYDDLDDFDGAVFSPPINNYKATLNDFAAYTQQITVENVSATNFEQVVADHSSANPQYFFRVTVKVFYGSKQVVSADWVRASYVEP
jgi:prepilin-type N-terminal cleavage/methylation domain-containing protein